MESVTYGKIIYDKCNYGKYNYDKCIYGKIIMANVAEPAYCAFCSVLQYNYRRYSSG